MDTSLEFFLIFLGTILITRIFLFLKPTPSPTVGGIRLHHYMFGIVAVFLGILISSLSLYAIGLGLFVNELTFLLIGGKNHEDNYSAKSLVGTLLFVILVFIFRNELLTLAT